MRRRNLKNTSITTEKEREMRELVEAIEDLKKSGVKRLIEARMREFKEAGEGPSSEVFNELCFCILTANFSADGSMRIQSEIEDGFSTLPEAQLAERLRELGHRYPKARARYIVEARKHRDSLKEIIRSFEAGAGLRDWLVEDVRGLGYKEASHFLRNIGYTDFAILDFHIVNLLVRHRLIEKPKVITKRRYLEIEGLLKEIARETNLSLGELDLYLWYMETGKVLK